MAHRTSRLTTSAARARLLLLLVLSVPAPVAAGNFSQYPGFDAWREAARRDPLPATPHEQRLLRRHRPRLLLPAAHPGPIDFYRDYIARGALTRGDGAVIRGPDPVTLNAAVDDPQAVFEHAVPGTAPAIPAVLYGRVQRVRIDAGDGVHRLTVLTWNAVFRHSGLPSGLTGALDVLASAAGAAQDWHQLDHYTAVSLVLDSAGGPLALMLQQHNYTRTWLLGESIQLPADGRPRVDVAIRSNELYPAARGPRWRRAVRFADKAGLRYLMGAGPEPLMAARDRTYGEREARYSLEFLRSDDAFYLFQGYLGERRMLPGRDGPPGADYNTLPALKPLELQLFVGYWREDSREDLARMELLVGEEGPGRDFALAQREVFFENLRCLRRLARVCR